MGDEDHRGPARPVFTHQRGEKIEPVPRVEPRRRLVEQPDVRLLGEGPREEDAPPFPAGERRGVPVHEVGDVASGHRLAGDPPVLRRVGGESPRPGRPTLEDQIQAANREDEVGALRHVRDAPRRFAARQPGKGEAVEERFAGGGRHDAREDFQERRLARAVLAEEGDDVSRRKPRVESAESRALPVERCERPGLETDPGGAHGFLRRSHAKSGAPRAAVTAPMGSSEGAATARETASATTRSAAPPRAENGRRIR